VALRKMSKKKKMPEQDTIGNGVSAAPSHCLLHRDIASPNQRVNLGRIRRRMSIAVTAVTYNASNLFAILRCGIYNT